MKQELRYEAFEKKINRRNIYIGALTYNFIYCDTVYYGYIYEKAIGIG